MPCYRPSRAVQRSPGEALVFSPKREDWSYGTDITVPCGKCVGCRTDRANMWARRCMHEASLWDHNCFLTLTYDDDHLPAGGFLVRRHLQLFVKRLRKRVSTDESCFLRNPEISSFRFLACGEYGTKFLRPHYHLLLFNLNMRDRYRVAKDYYESPCVSELWKYGTHKLGEVSHKSAKYVAKYSVKQEFLPEWCDPETGEVRPLPFLRMSLRPAIGRTWLERYATDLDGGYLVVDGTRVGIPRYYKEVLGEDWKAKFAVAQRLRGRPELSDRELHDEEVVARARGRAMSSETF